MLPKISIALAGLCAYVCAAQEAPQSPAQPQVKVHMLNVCTPSADEQQEIAAALARIPKRPAFSQDFEVDRGRSVLDQNSSPLPLANASASPGDPTTADFVRLRRDISGSGMFSNVQYSFSRDGKQMIETLVFRVRDPKDLLQVSIEDTASSVTPASTMLASATPASRVKLERFGKSSLVLARCSGSAEGPAPDQSRYEPLFTAASATLSDYRSIFGVKTLVPEELARIGRTGNSATKRPAKKAAAAMHKP